MKPKINRIFRQPNRTLLVGLPVIVILSASTHATEISKAGSGTNLSDGASWTGGTAPGSGDVASWITGSLRSGLSFGSETTWSGIKVRGTGGVGIGAGSQLKLGASGLDVNIGSGSTLNFTNTLNVTADQNWIIGASTGLGFNSGSALTGSSTITLTGAGYMNTRANMSSFTGTLDYGLGSRLQVEGNYSTWSNVALVMTSGVAFGSNGLVGTQTIGSLASSNASSSIGGGSQNGAVTYEIGALNQTTTFAGRILNGTNGGTRITSFSKVGTGVLTLTHGESDFTGSTTISAGAIKLGHATAISSSSAVTVNSNSGLRFGTGVTAVTLNDLGGTGSLVLTNDDSDGVAVTANNANNTTLSGAISGAGRLVKSGAGTLTLSSANSFAGGVTLNSGAINLQNATALGTGKLTLAGGTLNQGALSIGNAIEVTEAASLTYANNQFGSNSALSGNGTLNVTGSGVSVNLGIGDMTNFTGTLNILGGNFRKSTGSGSSASATVNIIGTSTSAAQYSRHSFVGTEHIGALSGNQHAILSGGNGTMTYSIGALNQDTTYSGLIRNGADGASVRVVSLTKTGTGVLTLDGTNTYSGVTNINDGVLLIHGSNEGTGNVNVAAGAVLGGSGIIAGAITNNGTLAPGNSPGILTASNGVTFGSGSIFEWELDLSKSNPESNLGVAYDGVKASSMSGSESVFLVKLTGTQDFSDAFWNQSRQWTDIFKSADGSSILTNWASVFGGGFQYSYNGQSAAPTTEGFFTASGNSLSWSPVPEPSNAMIGLLISAGLLLRRRL
jgi:autotransporter-associated beta strand protein